jgi:hypothetical protein
VSEPGKLLTAARIAVTPDGNIAQAVIDHLGSAFTRWYTGGSWQPWHGLGPGVADVSISAANFNGTDTAYICATFHETLSPRVYAFPLGGVPAGTEL